MCYRFCSQCQFLGSDRVVSINPKAYYNIFNLSYLYVMGLLYCRKMLGHGVFVELFEADFAVSPEKALSARYSRRMEWPCGIGLLWLEKTFSTKLYGLDGRGILCSPLASSRG